MNESRPALTHEERHHGNLVLNLIGDWDSWVKRRVETISVISDTALRRHVSVDFRVRSWFPKPVLRWDSRDVHYLPIALLNKEPLLNLDIRDESNRTLPLVTRRKNAAIATATLVALGQNSIFTAIRSAADEGADHEMPSDPAEILIPSRIESELYEIAYAAYKDPFSDSPCAEELVKKFSKLLTKNPQPIVDWKWTKQDDGSFEATADVDEWRYHLLRDSKFRRLMMDSQGAGS